MVFADLQKYLTKQQLGRLCSEVVDGVVYSRIGDVALYVDNSNVNCATLYCRFHLDLVKVLLVKTTIANEEAKWLDEYISKLADRTINGILNGNFV